MAAPRPGCSFTRAGRGACGLTPAPKKNPCASGIGSLFGTVSNDRCLHGLDRQIQQVGSLTIQEKQLKKPVVLIVEDEPLILMDAIDILSSAGFVTVEATSAAAAIEILDRCQDVVAVCTDIQIIGDPDGLKLAHLVRDRWPPIGLVITSGRVIPREDELPIGGMFLPKPYSPEGLVARVRSVMTGTA